jgi:hypothetical protein
VNPTEPTPGPGFDVGARVRFARPPSPSAYRAGQCGVVEAVHDSVLGARFHAEPGRGDPGRAVRLHWVNFHRDVFKDGRNLGNVRGAYTGDELDPA